MTKPVESKTSLCHDRLNPSSVIDLLIQNIQLKEKNNNWVSQEIRALQWSRTVVQVAQIDRDKAQALFDQAVLKSVWESHPHYYTLAWNVFQ